MSKRRNIGPRFGEYQINRVLSYIDDSAKKGTKRTLEDIAPAFLEQTIANEAEFNNYSGNLEEGYVAIVVSNGKQKRIFYHNAATKGRFYSVYTRRRKKGVRAMRRSVRVDLTRKRHNVTPWVKNTFFAEHMNAHKDTQGQHRRIRSAVGEEPKNYRYVKPWENEKGYKNRAKSISITRLGVGRTAKRTFLQIRNVAPYASFVQYGRNRNKHYNVLRGAMVDMWRRRVPMLIKSATLDELKAHGFRAPKR